MSKEPMPGPPPFDDAEKLAAWLESRYDCAVDRSLGKPDRKPATGPRTMAGKPCRYCRYGDREIPILRGSRTGKHEHDWSHEPYVPLEESMRLAERDRRAKDRRYREFVKANPPTNFGEGRTLVRRFEAYEMEQLNERIAARDAERAAVAAAKQAEVDAVLARKGWTIGDLSGVWAAVICIAVWFVTGMVADATWDGAGWLGVLPAAYGAWAWNKDHEYIKGLRR